MIATYLLWTDKLPWFQKWKNPGPKRYSQRAELYISPFANECRCVGLLDSTNKNSTWAVWCHGWMLLSHSQFEQRNNVADISSCTRWVVVQECLPRPTNRFHLVSIVNNLSIPREARIIPRDLSPENYRESKVVDLGEVVTEPNPQWSEFEFHWFFTKTRYGIASWEFDDQVPYTSLDVSTSLFSHVGASGRFGTSGLFKVSFYLGLCACLLSSSIVYLVSNYYGKQEIPPRIPTQ